MSGWVVMSSGLANAVGVHVVEADDAAGLARAVGTACTLYGAHRVEVVRRDAPKPEFQTLSFRRDGDWFRMEPGCPVGGCPWGTAVINLREQPEAIATDILANLLGLVEHLQEDHGALLPGSDEPTPTPQAIIPLDWVTKGPGLEQDAPHVDANTAHAVIEAIETVPLQGRSHAGDLAWAAIGALTRLGWQPGPDPIETGRQAALAQWEERWAALRQMAASSQDRSPQAVVGYMKRIEAEVPTGLPVSDDLHTVIDWLTNPESYRTAGFAGKHVPAAVPVTVIEAAERIKGIR